MAPKKKAAAKPPPPSSNGNGVASPPKSKAVPLPLLPSVVVAIVAFVGGVLTPPSLHAFRSIANLSSPNDSSFPLPLHTIPCTPSNLENYLHATPVPGLHMMCVEQLFVGDDGEERALPPTSDINEQRRRLGQIDSLRFTIYKGSHSGPLRRRIKVGGHGVGGVQSIPWPEVKMQLIRELGLVPEGKMQQPWALFTALGERIVGESDNLLGKGADEVGSNEQIMASIAVSGMVVIAQGGNWLWPGVREGFERTIELAPMDNAGKHEKPRNITIETLSMVPLVLSIKGFLSDEECDYIAKKAGPSMKYSSVSLKDADKGRAASDWRTSQSTFLSSKDDPTLRAIEDRTASLTRVPRNHQEYVQVLRYGTSEKYDAHHDFFDPKAYQSDPNTLRLIENGKKNRFATVFWYLTDVDDGGHTIFPRAGGLPPVRSHKDCTKGLKVQPQKGKVIIFYSLDASGAMDEYSLHGACPVGEGNVKWAANKWIWNAPMGYVS